MLASSSLNVNMSMNKSDCQVLAEDEARASRPSRDDGLGWLGRRLLQLRIVVLRPCPVSSTDWPTGFRSWLRFLVPEQTVREAAPYWRR